MQKGVELLKIVDKGSVCAVVYDHSKNALLMGTSGNSKKWQFAVGDDECSAPEVLSEQFGIEFDFVTDDTYSDTSDCVHCSDYGNIIIPVKKQINQGRLHITREMYCNTRVYVYEYNKNAVGKVIRGFKSAGIGKVRWVKMKDMFKTEMMPATLAIYNCFINHRSKEHEQMS